MPADVQGGSVADRILRVLAERWPVTLDDVVAALRVRPATVELEVKRLQARGLVVVERLGERTYVALSGAGARVVGLAPAEAARRRRAAKPAGERVPAPPPRPEDDPAFG